MQKDIDFTTILSDDVRKAIKSAGVKDYFVTDDSYIAPAYGDIERLFKSNALKLLKFRKNEYDCDDYARTASATLHILFGNIAVGEAAVKLNAGTHMLNVVILPYGDLVYVEPQTNKIVDYDVHPYFIII